MAEEADAQIWLEVVSVRLLLKMEKSKKK